MKCVCGRDILSKTIPLCPDCARTERALEIAEQLHSPDRVEFREWKQKEVKRCKLCSNECSGIALCGKPSYGALQYYEDPLPTNCCNSWFCEGSRLRGTNLAVFYYGCNFDCLFCQNWTHKLTESAPLVRLDELLRAAMVERVRCICHFGGSPEPQLPFAIRFSRKAIEMRKDLMICWEWNGAGHTSLAMKAAELSHKSGGSVKFDLKAWNPYLHRLLTGRENERVKENFVKIAERYPEVISATTLLVPYYVDKREIEGIAKFIASLNDEIPYSLLVFHPDYRLVDLPVTPKEQVFSCYRVAKKYLKKVNIGNLHLISI